MDVIQTLLNQSGFCVDLFLRFVAVSSVVSVEVDQKRNDCGFLRTAVVAFFLHILSCDGSIEFCGFFVAQIRNVRSKDGFRWNLAFLKKGRGDDQRIILGYTGGVDIMYLSRIDANNVSGNHVDVLGIDHHVAFTGIKIKQFNTFMPMRWKGMGWVYFASSVKDKRFVGFLKLKMFIMKVIHFLTPFCDFTEIYCQFTI